MRVPIQYALFDMARAQNRWNRLDISKVGALTFEKPDLLKFPALSLAYEAGKSGGIKPAILNAANEEAVKLFLKGKISFQNISEIIKRVVESIPQKENPTLTDILESDLLSRNEALKI